MAAQIQLAVCMNEAWDFRKIIPRLPYGTKGGRPGQSYGAKQSGAICYNVNQDYNKAFDYYEKSANQNYAPALFNVGICLLRGHGVAKDTASAIKYWRRSVEQDYMYAENSMGNAYFEGKMLPQNLDSAAVMFRKAGMQGCLPTELSLAMCYYSGVWRAAELRAGRLLVS